MYIFCFLGRAISIYKLVLENIACMFYVWFIWTSHHSQIQRAVECRLIEAVCNKSCCGALHIVCRRNMGGPLKIVFFDKQGTVSDLLLCLASSEFW